MILNTIPDEISVSTFENAEDVIGYFRTQRTIFNLVLKADEEDIDNFEGTILSNVVTRR